MKRFLAISVGFSFLSIVLFSPVVEAAKLTTNWDFTATRVTENRPCPGAKVIYKAWVKNTKNNPIRNARVYFDVHYKTTTTRYGAGYTDNNGVAKRAFNIGTATTDYRVVVKSVSVKNGKFVTDRTSFVPVECGK